MGDPPFAACAFPSPTSGWLAGGMSHEQIISDYPEFTEEDIRASLAYAADRERRLVVAAK